MVKTAAEMNAVVLVRFGDSKFRCNTRVRTLALPGCYLYGCFDANGSDDDEIRVYRFENN